MIDSVQDILKHDSPSVLVADDEKPIRDLFEIFLGRQGYKVSTVVDGFDALDEVKKCDYDILILDLKMPGMSGMEVLSRIKELNKELIIIVITGFATVYTAKEVIERGCFDYIAKPFDMENVGFVIKRAIEMRRLAEENKRFHEQVQVSEKHAKLTDEKRIQELTSINEELHATVDELRRSNEDLSILNAALERMVEERTAEIKIIKQQLKKKVSDLDIFHKAVVSRELKMKELKNRIKKLEKQLEEKGCG